VAAFATIVASAGVGERHDFAVVALGCAGTALEELAAHHRCTGAACEQCAQISAGLAGVWAFKNQMH
jgi:hypothetical protein